MAPRREASLHKGETHEEQTVLAVLGSFALLARAGRAGGRPEGRPRFGDLGSKVGVFGGLREIPTMAIQLAVEEVNAKAASSAQDRVISRTMRPSPPRRAQGEKLILQDDVSSSSGRVQRGTMAVMDVTKKHKVVHWELRPCAESCGPQVPQVLLLEPARFAQCRPTGSPKYISTRWASAFYIFYTDYAMGQSDAGSSRRRWRSGGECRRGGGPLTPRTSAR